jgi:hypothetical protein
MARGLLTFSGSLSRDPAVDAWFDARANEVGSMARRWFARIRECGSDVRELVHDGFPTACVGNAPFAYTNVFNSHVNVGFFHGDALADPGGLLQGSGKFMRHVTLRPGVAADDALLEALIAAAYQDIKARLPVAKWVLALGLDPAAVDPATFQPFTTAQVTAFIETQLERIRQLGHEVQSCLVDLGATAEGVVARQLEAKSFDCVLIGAGLRAPEGLLLFEKLLNLVHERAPRARICFNTSPADSAEAVQRWI